MVQKTFGDNLVNENGEDEVEFKKFKLNVQLTDQQGMLWFLLSIGIVIYFWAAATPTVWNDQLARLVIYAVVFSILLVGMMVYTLKRGKILDEYASLDSKGIGTTSGIRFKKTSRRLPPEERQLQIWLTEYAAANATRDHYDSNRWFIGSIFIAAIFTLFASSFLDSVARSNIGLGLLADTSIILWFVFVYYDQHVQPWIKVAIDRCHKIEENLRSANYDIHLHAWIKYQRDKSDRVNFKIEHSELGAAWVLWLFSISIPTIWILRLWFVQ